MREPFWRSRYAAKPKGDAVAIVVGRHRGGCQKSHAAKRLRSLGAVPTWPQEDRPLRVCRPVAAPTQQPGKLQHVTTHQPDDTLHADSLWLKPYFYHTIPCSLIDETQYSCNSATVKTWLYNRETLITNAEGGAAAAHCGWNAGMRTTV